MANNLDSQHSASLTQLRDSLITSLKTVSTLTESVYLGMTETYPNLIRELDSQIGLGSSEKDYLSEMVDRSIGSIKGQTEQYQVQQNESAVLIAQVKDLLGSLMILQTSVNEIREDSIQMELISLNALVAASKAGTAGKGFSCITSELKQLSAHTMELTERSTVLQTEIDESFNTMKSLLEKLDEEELTTLRAFHEQVMVLFQKLKTISTEISDGLGVLRKRADEIKRPMMKIIVEVQNQDRIRQGIDQVFLLFQEIPDFAELDHEKKLDSLAYLEILPNLCRMILEETEDQIHNNLQVFSQSIGETDTLVAELESARRLFLSRHLDATGEDSILKTFTESQNCFSGLKDFLDGMNRKRHTSLKGSQVLQNNVDVLVDVLNSFESILEKFRNIDVASRIEVARYSALAAIKDNTQASTRLTGKIDADVHRSADLAKDFSHKVTTLLENYSDQFDRRMEREAALEHDLENVIQLMGESRQKFSQSLRENQVLAGTFLEKLTETKDDLLKLTQLNEKIREQYAVLDHIEEQIRREKEQLMAEGGMTDWVPDKSKLQSVIDRFTIFIHKQKAAAMADFHITASAESGDVTLF